MKGIPEKIYTDRLLLRFIRADDAFNVRSYACDESINMMMFYPHRTPEETDEYIKWALSEYEAEEYGTVEYLVEYKGRAVGGVSIDLHENGTAELGWLINQKFRSYGIATEAAKALIEVAGKRGVKTVIARCDSRNTASERVMNKLGMLLIDDTGVREYPRTGEKSAEKTYALAMDCKKQYP